MNLSKSIAIILSLACTISHAEQRFQSHESIYQIVENTVAKKLDNNSAEYNISVIPLDEQLQLPECTQALEASTTAETIKAGRVSVAVRCNAEQKWAIYTSSIVKAYKAILILSQPVQRGEAITPAMFFSERRDVSNLREDYFTQAQQLENKQASRPLAAGTVLSIRNVSAQIIVKRNDKVLIRSLHTGLAITMSGTAMVDGYQGQLIRVKNQNSGRIINATVIEPGLVAVE